MDDEVVTCDNPRSAGEDSLEVSEALENKAAAFKVGEFKRSCELPKSDQIISKSLVANRSPKKLQDDRELYAFFQDLMNAGENQVEGNKPSLPIWISPSPK